MRLKVESLAGGGRGVARAGGRVWFVAGALPGEEVEAELESERAGVIEARARTVYRPGPMREKDPCPAAPECGGCDLAHLRRASAKDALREIITGALRHAPAELAAAVARAPVVVSPMAWRLRARLHWDPESRVLGFFSPRSYRAIDISPCRVVSPRLLAALPEIATALTAARAGVGEVEWLEDLESETAVAGWRGSASPPRGPVSGLAGFHPLTEAGAIRRGGWGKQSVVMRLPVPLRVPIGAFFQGNRHLVPLLFARVAEIAASLRPSGVVDLFGGVGFLAAAARHAGAGHVVVVEAQRSAARAAAENLRDAEVAPIEAEEYLLSPATPTGTLAVLDPPRSGLTAVARRRLAAWGPEAILWLSCDPAAFGRDAADLLAAGYRLVSLEIWDLFAGSHHAETLALFRRGRR
jgi:23S rRNA (uracil1939-C5)-methyltransferase